MPLMGTPLRTATIAWPYSCKATQTKTAATRSCSIMAARSPAERTVRHPRTPISNKKLAWMLIGMSRMVAIRMDHRESEREALFWVTRSLYGFAVPVPVPVPDEPQAVSRAAPGGAHR